jgi:FAD/FMN-containing dehydrogenase
MNAAQLDNILKHTAGQRSPVDANLPWHVLAELGDTADEPRLRSGLEDVMRAALSKRLLADAAVASNEAQRAALWKLRHSVVEANNRAGRRILFDIAVPISRIPDFVRRASSQLQQRFRNIHITIVGHFGDGNLHFSPLFRFEHWNAIADTGAVVDEIRGLTYDLVAELGGSFSAEHGIGQYLVAEMRQYKSEVELNLMRSVKHALDPLGLFNPAKVIPK